MHHVPAPTAPPTASSFIAPRSRGAARAASPRRQLPQLATAWPSVALITCSLLCGLALPRPLLAGVAGYNGPDSGLSGLTHTLLSDDLADLSSWTHVDGNSPTLAANDPDGSHEPCLSLANSLVRAELNQTLTQDFTVSFKVRHTGYSRGQWVGLFNAAGTKGYGVFWDSALSSQHSGQGWVQLRKFDLGSELNDWTQDGAGIGGVAPSGHPAAGRGRA